MASTTAASDEPERPAELQAPGYAIFIGLLAVISMFNFAIWLLPVDADTKAVARIIDVPITIIFLLDFALRGVVERSRAMTAGAPR